MMYRLHIKESGFEKKIIIQRDHTGYELVIAPEESKLSDPNAVVIYAPVTNVYRVPVDSDVVTLDFNDDPEKLPDIKKAIESMLMSTQVNSMKKEYNILNNLYTLVISEHITNIAKISLSRQHPQFGLILRKATEKRMEYVNSILYVDVDIPYNLYLLMPDDTACSFYAQLDTAKVIVSVLTKLLEELQQLQVKEYVADIHLNNSVERSE